MLEAASVRKMLPFLACLMLMLTTWAGMAHAIELRGIEASQIDMASHVAGDGDEVPADADKGYPHHHASCHEHDVDAPVVGSVAVIEVHRANAPPISIDEALTSYLPDRALRPPQA